MHPPNEPEEPPAHLFEIAETPAPPPRGGRRPAPRLADALASNNSVEVELGDDNELEIELTW